jgi:hypothetical protein
MLSRMVPSSPPAKRTLHLLKVPDILCANDIAVLGRNRVANLAVDCCRFSDAGKGKPGTILAHSWHNFGTNDFDIRQLFDFK